MSSYVYVAVYSGFLGQWACQSECWATVAYVGCQSSWDHISSQKFVYAENLWSNFLNIFPL